MKVLFLGYEKDHLQIIDHIKDKSTIIDAVGYEDITIDKKVHKKDLCDIKINEYNIIFVSEYLTEEEVWLFDNYDGQDHLLFKGLRWVELKEIKNRSYQKKL